MSNIDDLLADIPTNTGNGDPTDLLNEIDDSGAEAWVPENAGDGIQGVVLFVGEQPDEYSDDTVPVVTVKTPEGAERRIIGFASVLRREIREKDPQKGDVFAVKFIGEQELKKGKFAGRPVKIYRAAVRRASAGQAAA